MWEDIKVDRKLRTSFPFDLSVIAAFAWIPDRATSRFCATRNDESGAHLSTSEALALRQLRHRVDDIAAREVR